MPVIDRTTVEQLFGVARRRAIHLMNEFGGYQSGRTLLVDRQRLITLLAAQASGEAFEYEIRRRERIADKLAALQVQDEGCQDCGACRTRRAAEHTQHLAARCGSR